VLSKEDMEFVENLFRSLEREMGNGLQSLRQEMNTRFDRMEARLDA